MSPRRWAVTLLWVCTCVILQLHCVTAENRCVFPFKYKNKEYFDCPFDTNGNMWCSLTEEYSGAWKHCTDHERPQCVFPFIYKGEVFYGCTRRGSSNGLFWCSLTQRYDLDKAWKYCFY